MADSHKRWVAVHPDGTFVGTKRFTYKIGGTIRRRTVLGYARIFTRAQDAQAACPKGGHIATVTVTLDG